MAGPLHRATHDGDRSEKGIGLQPGSARGAGYAPGNEEGGFKVRGCFLLAQPQLATAF